MSLNELLPLRRSRRDIRPSEQATPLTALQRQMNRLFDDFFGDFALSPFEGWNASASGFVPRMNVSESDKEIEVTAELPGMEQKDVEVLLEDGRLTLRGEKKMEKEEKEDRYYHLESSYGSFSRSVEVGEDIDPDQVQASFRNGVLTIRLPKTRPEPTQRKRIEIKTG